MAIPTIPVYTGGVANPDGSQNQQEFTTNMFNQLSYEAALAPSLNNTVNEMNNVAGQVDTNAAIAQSSADAAQAAANFEGEFVPSTTSAEKGKSYSYNGEVWLCLQNTTTTPSQGAPEWKLSVGERYVTTAQGDILGGKLFKGSNGEHVQNGDVVPSGTTHLRVLIVGEPTIVSISPIASGMVSNLTSVGATIGGTPVYFLQISSVEYFSDSNNSAFDKMILGVPTYIRVGDKCRCENGTVFVRTQDSPEGNAVFEFVSAIHVKDFVKRGELNLTRAVSQVAKLVNKRKSAKIIYPFGDYLVGEQVANPNPTINEKYWQSSDHLQELVDCSGIFVDLTGCNLKFIDGYRYGSFDPLTGLPHSTGGSFYQEEYAAYLGSMFEFVRCKNVIVLNPNLDGNMENAIVGGGWGDVDIQLDMTGIRFRNCKDYTVINGVSNNMPLDGYAQLKETSYNDFCGNGTFLNCSADKNGRQGLSWIGGDNMAYINCAFTNTAQGKISSSPKSDVDIEDNGNESRDGTFLNCLMAGGKGTKLLAFNTPKNISFMSCTFAGEGRGVWVKPINDKLSDTKFTDCKFYCNVVYPGVDTVFDSCTFSDEGHLGYGSTTYPILETGNATELTKFNNCRFISTKPEINIFFFKTGTFSGCELIVAVDNPPADMKIGIFEPYKVRGFEVIDRMTNASAVEPAGDHAFIDSLTSATARNWDWADFNLNGSRISTSPSGETGMRVGTYNRNTVSKIESHTSTSATEMKIRLPLSSNIIQLLKVNGDNDLKRCRATLITNTTIASPTEALHDTVILSKVEFGLGSGSIEIVKNDSSEGNYDILKITSAGGKSLLNEEFILRIISLDNAINNAPTPIE